MKSTREPEFQLSECPLFTKSQSVRRYAGMTGVTYADMDREMGVFGDPEYCIARIRELQAEYGFDEFICYFNQGGLMDPTLVKQSMTLFAQEVMPHLR